MGSQGAEMNIANIKIANLLRLGFGLLALLIVLTGALSFIKATGAEGAFTNVVVAKPYAGKKFKIEEVRCIGCCGLAPVVSINEDIAGRLTPEQVAEMVQKLQNQ